jgi:hypothetical protein
VIEDVGSLLGDAIIRLLAGGPGHLLGLLPDLLADVVRVGQQVGGVGTVRRVGLAGADGSFERGQGGEGGVVSLGIPVVEARALAGVTGGSVRLHQGQNSIRIAVVGQGFEALGVAGGGALVPQLPAGAAPEVHLPRGPGALQGLGVHVGERQHLAAAPVLHDAGHQPPLVVVDRCVVHRGGGF